MPTQPCRRPALARAFVFGYAFCAAQCIGSRLGGGWAAALPIALLVLLPAVPGALLGAGYLWGARRLAARAARPHSWQRRPDDGRCFALALLVLFLAWLPVLLAYWPGLFTYDALAQAEQLLSGAYTTHHPLAHTLLFGALYGLGAALGGPNAGMALYTVVQMLLLAASIAYMLLFLRRMGWPRWLRGCLLAFFAVLPVFSVLSVSMTKDVLFSAAFLAFFTHLCHGLAEPACLRRRGYLAGYVALAVLLCLLRNNGIYALALMLPAGLCLPEKRCRKTWLPAGLAAIALALLLGRGLAVATGAQKGSVKEALSVPCQQVMAVYEKNGNAMPTAGEQALFRALAPGATGYKHYLADNAKDTFAIDGHLGDFARLYFACLRREPATCVQAFLRLNKGYWDLGDASHAEIYGSSLQTRRGYFLLDSKDGYILGIEHRSLFPALEEWYAQLFAANAYRRLPVVRLLFSPALYFWLLVLGAFYAVELRARRALAPLLLLGGLMLTLLAGPCCLIRYALPFPLCVAPLYALLCRGAPARP